MNQISKAGLTQNKRKVAVIHELPLREDRAFSDILRKSYKVISKDIVDKHHQ